MTEVTAGSRRHRIKATGFVRGADADRAAALLHPQIIAILKREMSLDGIDEVGTDLRTGIDVGIYNSVTNQVRREPAH